MCSKSLRWKRGVGGHLGVFPESGDLCKVEVAPNVRVRRMLNCLDLAPFLSN
jgi:hypothetical protein